MTNTFRKMRAIRGPGQPVITLTIFGGTRSHGLTSTRPQASCRIIDRERPALAHLGP